MNINALDSVTKSKLKATILLILRLLLAIFGGFTLPLIFCVFVPQLLRVMYNVDVAPVLVWMMLIAFAFYTLIILWVLSTKKLAKTAFILITLTCTLYIASHYLINTNALHTNSALTQVTTL